MELSKTSDEDNAKTTVPMIVMRFVKHSVAVETLWIIYGVSRIDISGIRRMPRFFMSDVSRPAVAAMPAAINMIMMTSIKCTTDSWNHD